ncbi:GlsB/YeaQ/YmgE family stress response membrane protein [Tropicimonas sp. IMCC6043]|uniref:GlsB/YeaQ/YmgE family stress response membrane protein n=1 Tax=Tropicimonas sp. IMCC6043 TaxID=2510645 RepID=UPI00101BB110|nr:GlsB/YeaQ/YmgE family stress response membrane protein [Tropicimonas sp. IMCC6043]RYH06870.1 GlsB/YeaQ/YmgE family stress response membrane protein [Tropicimonas sp. IMCC6043]
MHASSLIAFLVIGLVAGWLASFVVGGSGLVTYLVSGVIGAFVGPFALRLTGLQFEIGGPLVTQILVSAIGAIIVVLLARLIA